METKIQEIIDYITATGLIERFGGWCFNKTDKELPYGVAITNTNKGTLYGFDDNFFSSGYVWVKDIVSTGIRNQVKVTLGIYVFTPRTKWSEEMNTFDLPLDLYAQLNRKYKEIRFNSVIVDKYIANEVALIEIDFLAYGSCDVPTPVWWDFEGTMTVGTLAGEGGLTEHGYRAGWGDDYGTLASFYTQYQYAGLYWNDDTLKLYVWGVNADVVQIGTTVFTEGTFNSEGYTTFEASTNPFTWATAAIKVKGSATETWDYEGVMTVGEDDNSIFFGYDTGDAVLGGIGLLPDYKYRYNTYRFIYWNSGSLKIKISIECQYLKIANQVYNLEFAHDSGISSIDEETNPFPEVDETCTIKVKL